jgi:pimeloyl-ACP methyl ester carboxylesterase
MTIFSTLRKFVFFASLLMAFTIPRSVWADATDSATPRPLPTIVLVHGAWADGSSWNRVIPMLQSRGFHVIAVQIPLTSLSADAAVVKRVLAAQTGPVVLVGHSYGGAVITEAGNQANVKALVYVAAFAPAEGQSPGDLAASFPATPIGNDFVPDAQGFVTLTQKGVENDFAQDLPKREADVLFAVQGPTSINTLTEKATTAAWKSKPSWYIVARHDRAINPDLEAFFANRMQAHTIKVNSSHVPMLSRPNTVTNMIMSAAFD